MQQMPIDRLFNKLLSYHKNMLYIILSLAFLYVLIYVSILPGMGFNVMIPYFIQLAISIIVANKDDLPVIKAMNIAKTILTMVLGLTLLCDGGTKIISTGNRQAVASRLYPVFPIIYVEADEVSRIPPQNREFRAPDRAWEIETSKEEEIYLLKNKNGKQSIFQPYSDYEEINKTFRDLDDFTIVSRYYFPFGYINAIKFHKNGKTYITDIYGKKINVFDIPEIYEPEDVSYYQD